MRSFERVTDAFRNAGLVVREVAPGKAYAQGPDHSGRDRSISISYNGVDSVLMRCHAGEETVDVLAAVGLTLRDLYDDPKGTRYLYPDGRVVHRSPDKRFKQSGNTKGTSLFRADEVRAAITRGETVYVVEGEKDVLAIESAGGVATCSAMGAGKARQFDWSPLVGGDVVIVADKDEPGRKHAATVRGILTREVKAASARIVQAKTGKDAADHVAAEHGLDEFEPMPEPEREDGARLLDDALAVLGKFVVLPDEHAAVSVVLWIAATHSLAAFEHAPRLVINSPEKRCGKSRLLDLINEMSHDPIACVSATGAAVYRIVDERQEHPPTLLIDEADTMFGTKRAADENESLRGLFNAGFQRGRTALRCDGPSNQPREFATFAMAAFAGIGNMPDTITDRAVSITMRRRKEEEHAAPFRSRRDGPALKRLRERFAAWAAQNLDALTEADPDMPVEDRAADTWYPLIAVADQAGGSWPTRARAACEAMTEAASTADEESSSGVRLLKDIKDIYQQSGALFIPSGELVGKLRNIPEAPWAEWELTVRKLAARLKQFKVESASTGKVRGYKLSDFTDAFARYLPDKQPGNPSKVSEPSKTTTDEGEPSDTSRSADTSIRQSESKRQNETAVQVPNLTHLTLLTDRPREDSQEDKAEHDHCEICGGELLHPISRTTGVCHRCKPVTNDEMAAYYKAKAEATARAPRQQSE